MTEPDPQNLTMVFVRLKLRLLLNGSRRARSTLWARIGFYLSLLNSALAGVAGFVVAVLLRHQFDAAVQHRLLVIGISIVVVGWWFGPLISGGVDETIDPARLVLLPLTRRQIRRGQIAAGFVGQAPLVVMIWMSGLVIGLSRSVLSAVLVSAVAAVVLLAAPGRQPGDRHVLGAPVAVAVGGGDLAAFVAVVGGAGLFVGLQVIRFVDAAALDDAAGILRWFPPGLAGEALEYASLGRPLQAAWRVVPLVGVFLLSGWWWSRQLDRLLVEPSRIGGGQREVVSAGSLAIFSGLRRFLPHTSDGAAVAREMIYLVRSPGRRAALLAGTILGLVYVALFGLQGYEATRSAVLFAPVAMLFSLQFASNQLGVDPTCFWLEVAVGPDPPARWWGRQLLGGVAAGFPVLIAALVLAIWTGGWTEFVVVVVCCGSALMTLVGVGSLLSPGWVTPVPDSGNPFGNKQSMSGAGCSTAILGMLYIALIGVLLVPAELALIWAVRNSASWVAGLVAGVIVGLNWLFWKFSTVAARRVLPGQEHAVLARLDARLNA